ncbi:MAG: VanW family protein [Lachnospiraceae bacterium]|nr:VanW family protein [Lachnospiraceae bacterium]
MRSCKRFTWLLAIVLLLFAKPIYADPDDAPVAPDEGTFVSSDIPTEAEGEMHTAEDAIGSVDPEGETSEVATEEAFELPEDAKIPAGVFLDDIEIGGLTVAEVDALVEERLKELGEKKLRLSTPKTFVQIPLGELGLTWANRSEVHKEASSLVLPGSLVTQYKSKKDLEYSSMTLSLETKVDRDSLVKFLLDHMEELNCEPKNAYVRRFANEFTIVDGTEGIAISEDATYNEIVSAIKTINTDLAEARILKVDAVGNTTKPEFYKDVFEGFGDLLGEYSTLYSTANGDRTTNVTVATTKFNGMTIYPGQEVSALEIMRPVTEEGGYKKAPTYTSSGVEDETGGGICQVATTLYNAILQSELEVTYRKNHSRTPTYVPLAQDAMVYSAGNSDFKFRNNLDHPIYIESFVDNSGVRGKTTFRIYGVEYRDPNRTVEYKAELVSYSIPAEGASPYEYFRLQSDSSLTPFGEVNGDPSKVYAEFVSSFYPAAVAKLHKIVYVNGEVVSNTVINTSNYTNRSAGHTAGTYITGVYKAHPDTIIESIEYNVDYLLAGREPSITWAERPAPPPTTEAPQTTEAPTTEDDTEEDGTANGETKATTKAPAKETEKPKGDKPKEDKPKDDPAKSAGDDDYRE